MARNDFELHIVGTGSDIEWCEQYVIKNGLDDKVIFHGRHPFEEMPNSIGWLMRAYLP